MCKIMIIPGLKPKNSKLVYQFMDEMGRLMSTANDDGLGYVALSKDGNMFGEKWFFNHEAFDNREEMHPGVKALEVKPSPKTALGDFVELETVGPTTDVPPFRKYGVFGTVPEDGELTTVMLHARRATGTISFQNVHPFVDLERNAAIIHNGVISNHEKSDCIRSTCDSERILNMYLKHNVDKNPLDFQKMFDELKGWMAVGALGKDKSNRWVIDIFKTATASLGCAFVKELDAMVFSTDVTDIRDACESLGLTIVSKSKGGVKDDMLLRLDAVTGKQLLLFKYKDTRYNQYHYNYKPDYKTDDDMYKEEVAKWQAEKERERLREEEERKERFKKIEDRRNTGNVTEVNFNQIEARPNKQEDVEEERSSFTEGELREALILKRIKEFEGNNWDAKTCREVAEREVDEYILRKKIRAEAERVGKKNGWNGKGIDTYESSLIRTAVKHGKIKLVVEQVNNLATTSDPMNEAEAAKHGYTLDSNSGLWVKRKVVKQ